MSVSETIQEVLQSLVDFSAPMDTCAQGARIPTYLCLEGGTPVTEKDFKTFLMSPRNNTSRLDEFDPSSSINNDKQRRTSIHRNNYQTPPFHSHSPISNTIFVGIYSFFAMPQLLLRQWQMYHSLGSMFLLHGLYRVRLLSSLLSHRSSME